MKSKPNNLINKTKDLEQKLKQDNLKLNLSHIASIFTILAGLNVFYSLYILNQYASQYGFKFMSLYSLEDVLLIFPITFAYLKISLSCFSLILVVYISKNIVFFSINTCNDLKKFQNIFYWTFIVFPIIAFLLFILICPKKIIENYMITLYAMLFFSILIAYLNYLTVISLNKGLSYIFIVICILSFASIRNFFISQNNIETTSIEFNYKISNVDTTINTQSDSLLFIMHTSKGFIFRDTLKNITYFYENERISNLKITTEEKSKK